MQSIVKSVRIPQDMAKELAAKCTDIGLTEGELIRLSIASFLAKENAMAEYLAAIEALEIRMDRFDEAQAVTQMRLGLFATNIAKAALIPDSAKSPEMQMKYVSIMQQIVETVH